jgi:predicted DNA-binding transcriptional regulator YafY
MAKDTSISKKLILIYLQQFFLEKTDATHYVTMKEILNFLESKDIYADRRTIYSAISLLDYVNFRIEGIPEKGNYKYHHTNRLFDTAELKILIDSVAASKYLTEKKSRELITKIKSLGCSFDSETLNRNILMRKKVKSMNDKVLKNLDIIYSAIHSNLQISFQYMKWTPQKKLDYVRKGELYLVSPFAVTLNDDNYYLISFDKKNQRLQHYRIDKMQTLNLTTEPREGIGLFKHFDIADYSLKTFGMFSGKEETVSIQCKNSLAGVFIDRFGTDCIRPDFQNPNKFIARIKVNISPQFYAWLFGLGKDIKILSPDSVIEEYSSMLQKVMENYQ